MGITAFIFPGQGSQYVGMGKQLWDASEDVRRLYRAASERAEVELAGVSFEGPQEELDSDLTAQLAVYVCNEAHRMAASGLGLSPGMVTGYSLGFYSAMVAAGCLDFMGGLEAVKRAGELAVESSASEPGTMGAVIGLGLDELESVCGEVRKDAGVWVSNINASRQILVSGSVTGVKRAVELSAERGALSAYVLGMGAAYHSPMMESASRKFREHVAKMGLKAPSLPLVSYLDAGYIDNPGGLGETVSAQITRRVLWKDTLLRMIEDDVSEFVEVGPGSALTRMVRWVDRGVKATAIETLLENKDNVPGVS